MKKTLTLFAIVIFALVTPSDVSAEPNQNSKPRPFKARFSTEFFNAAFDPATFYFTTVVVGDGQATHLGKCSFAAEHKFAFTTQSQSEGIARNGTMQLGASNGDILNATYTGDIVLSGDSEAPFLLLFTVTFNGGTGRFTHATGSAEVIGLTTIEPDPSNDLFKGASEFTFDGTIAY